MAPCLQGNKQNSSNPPLGLSLKAPNFFLPDPPHALHSSQAELTTAPDTRSLLSLLCLCLTAAAAWDSTPLVCQGPPLALPTLQQEEAIGS